MPPTLNKTELVQIGGSAGHTVVDINGPLTRLNYFDGKFLRAPDLQAEQAALLAQVRTASQAGGGGVVHGFDCTLVSGDTLRVGAGLGFDWQGRPLLMSENIDIGIAGLINTSQNLSALSARSANSGIRADFADCPVVENTLGDDNVITPATHYLIVLSHIEAQCGEDDVYGKLCSEACISDTARSHIVEGVEISAVPVTLALKQSSQPFDNRHLRSRAASALFEKERAAITSLISGSGLSSNTWCLGADPLTGQGVAIALFGRNASSTLYLDGWAARRERMETPPYQYWAARLAMRSDRIYLAQIAQFQCQLRDCLRSAVDKDQPHADDPCADEKALLRSTADEMDQLVSFYARAADEMPTFVSEFSVASQQLDINALERQIETLRNAAVRPASDQILIDCGIVETPSAGYLPVAPLSNLSVNDQVRQLLGNGVDLRFCVVWPDFVPHALEEAQHMERICLVSGLDDPSQKPQLDVLVPGGKIAAVEEEARIAGLNARVELSSMAVEIGWPRDKLSGVRPASEAGTGPIPFDSDNGTGFSGEREFAARAARFEDNRLGLPALGGAARSAADDSGASFYLAAETPSASDFAVDAIGAVPQSVLSLLLDDGEDAAQPIRDFDERAVGGQRINTNFGLNLSLWSEMSASLDPFSASAGDKISVRARFTLVVRRSGVESLMAQRTINGQLIVEKNARISGGSEVAGRLVAQGSWQNRQPAGRQQKESVAIVNINDAFVMRRANLPGLPPATTIIIRNPSFFGGLDNVNLVFESTSASSDKKEFRAYVQIQSAGFSPAALAANLKTEAQELDIIRGTLANDETALTPGSAPHSASLDAINVIDKSLAGAGFAEHASNLLFPAPEPLPDELRITAQQPWVLFHRRRTKVCEIERAAEVVRPARTYRVFHADLDPNTSTDAVFAAIREDFASAIAGVKIRPAGTVEFASGQQSVATPHDDVRANWESAVQTDADMHVGVIASQGDAIDDGVSLANARLQTLTNVLGPVTQSADELQLLTTSSVPTSLSTGGLDGVVVYFTREVGTVCHSIIRLLSRNPDAIGEALNEYFADPGDLSLLTFMQRIGGEILPARPRFVGGTDEYFTSAEAPQLSSAWSLAGNGPVTNALSISPESEADAQAIALSQSQQIVTTVGSELTGDDLLHRQISASLMKDCRHATAILAAIECNDVYILRVLSQEPSASVKQIMQVIAKRGFTPGFLDDNPMITRLGEVDFFADTSSFEPDSKQAFVLRWQSALSGQSPAGINTAVIGVARPGADNAETADNVGLAKDQSAIIAGTMGVSVQLVDAVPHSTQTPLPVECRAVSLVIVAQPPRTGVLPVGVVTAGVAVDGGNDFTADNANGVRFNENNEVVRDSSFNRAIEILRDNAEPVTRVEIVSLDGSSDEVARARAEAMLVAMRERGVATDDARIVEREADVIERTEILRSGMVLNNGLILRRQ